METCAKVDAGIDKTACAETCANLDADKCPESAAAGETCCVNDGKKYFTMDDVRKHSTCSDLWLAIHGKVYNVTDFQEDHPGGDEILLDNAEMDASTAFDDVGHSPEALDSMKQYYIGDLAPGWEEEERKRRMANRPQVTRIKNSQSESPAWQKLLPPLIIVLLALFYKFYLAPPPVLSQ
jgi:cytochrome b involved in lipid metabolism